MAELLLMFGMAVCSCLLVIRVLKRIVGAVPLATVSLACGMEPYVQMTPEQRERQHRGECECGPAPQRGGDACGACGFGVLPSLLLFAPFRVVSSWFVPGGVMLPARCAELLRSAPSHSHNPHAASNSEAAKGIE